MRICADIYAIPPNCISNGRERERGEKEREREREREIERERERERDTERERERERESYLSAGVSQPLQALWAQGSRNPCKLYGRKNLATPAYPVGAQGSRNPWKMPIRSRGLATRAV